MTRHEPADQGLTPSSSEHVAELVRALASVMQSSSVTELDLELGALSLHLRRPHEIPAARTASVSASDHAEPAPEEVSGHTITAPMVGTFYVAATPSSTPFVAEGDEIVAGQTIGIIEAMKIMNEITADRSGIVQEIMARNGQPVEYGSPLIRLSSR